MNFLGVKFHSKLAIEDLVLGIVSRDSENWYYDVISACLCGHLCATSLLQDASVHPILIVLQCGSLQLNVIFSFSSSRCIRWSGYALIKVFCPCVIDVMLLECVRSTRLIRTEIIVCSVNFHLLLPEFDIPSCGRSSFIGVRSSKL